MMALDLFKACHAMLESLLACIILGVLYTTAESHNYQNPIKCVLVQGLLLLIASGFWCATESLCTVVVN